MKNKLIVFLLTLTLFFGLTYSNLKVKAESEPTDPATEDVINSETNTEEEQPKINPKSNIELWFEKNLGWVVGIPIGTLITALIELIYLAKKSKEKLAELKETKDFNKFAKEQVELGNEMYKKSQELFVACQETIGVIEANVSELNGVLTAKVNDIAKRLDNTDALVIETKNTFDGLNAMIEANKVQVEKLQEAILLVSTHTKELVANSTAEEIVKLVKGE